MSLISRSLTALLFAVAFSHAVAVRAEPGPVPCARKVLGNLGPENGFSIVVEPGTEVPVRGPYSVLKLGLTVVPPFRSQLWLVQLLDGVRVGSWQLDVVVDEGVATECALSSDPMRSNCGAALVSLPHATGGYWTLAGMDGSVVEATLSVIDCHQ